MLKVLILLSLSSVILSLPQIDVYVESLCPDCMGFIADSFKEFHNNPDHEKLANVTFYAFGNAKENKNGSNWEFTCQHGPNECYGNILETCAQNIFPKNEFHSFLICLESNILETGKNFDKSAANCISDKSILQEVMDCVNSPLGNILEHIVAQATPSDHKYVPWILFNGVHNTNIENQILNDMTNFLCGLDDETKKLPGCQDYIDTVSECLLAFENNTRCENVFLSQQLKFLE